MDRKNISKSLIKLKACKTKNRNKNLSVKLKIKITLMLLSRKITKMTKKVARLNLNHQKINL
jgi:hypothetical protein